MRIEELNIFFIKEELGNTINRITSYKGSKVNYLEMDCTNFMEFINLKINKFLVYNPNSVFILRDGHFLDIKNIFATINNCPVNIGRGGSQKSHGLSRF